MKYVVILETSSIVDGNPIRPSIISFISKYKTSREILIESLIPELSKDEFRKNVFFEFKKFEKQYLDGQKEIKNLLSINLPKRNTSKTMVLNKVDNFLKKNKIKVIKTPLKKIKIEKILKKAVWYEPPFNMSTKEKGFKDSIIAETVLNFVKSHRDTKVFFICQDEKLREYTIEILKRYTNSKVYENIAKLEAEIEFNLNQINQQKQQNLIAQAKKTFDELVKSENLISTIEAQNLPIFNNPRASGLMGLLNSYSWKPTGETSGIEILEPEFKEKENQKLIWQTKIDITKRYYQDNSLPSVYGGTVQNTIRQYTKFKFRFSVDWESIISDDDKITSSKIIKIIYEKTSEINEFGFMGYGATGSTESQGTASVYGGSLIEDLLKNSG